MSASPKSITTKKRGSPNYRTALAKIAIIGNPEQKIKEVPWRAQSLHEFPFPVDHDFCCADLRIVVDQLRGLHILQANAAVRRRVVRDGRIIMKRHAALRLDPGDESACRARYHVFAECLDVQG